ncbi:VanZ family protein [Oceanisphaera avium]|uniref:VanZ family protein n=1 Tax=Oceanisphaera avium TaxID=1903694 RepID=UPI0018DF65E9|nr:VanZ family protein [Oceanisphaera avium]
MQIFTVIYKLRWLLFVTCLSVLCYGLFRPQAPPNPFSHSDKVLHCLAFFGFSLVARFAFLKRANSLIWLVVLALAPASEYLQHYLQPHRSFSWLDILANSTGVILGLLVWLALQEHIKNRL